jgi:hypothetical protein
VFSLSPLVAAILANTDKKMDVEVVMLDRIFETKLQLGQALAAVQKLHITSSQLETRICQQCCAEKPKM